MPRTDMAREVKNKNFMNTPALYGSKLITIMVNPAKDKTVITEVTKILKRSIDKCYQFSVNSQEIGGISWL